MSTNRHPSGRPLRVEAVKSPGFYRPFTKGFVNERLNEPTKDYSPQAIGFISPIDPVIWEDDLYAKQAQGT
jgi:hypothetical protein